MEKASYKSIPEMLVTDTFVKLCSIMVVDAPVCGMRPSIISGGGLAHVRLGKDGRIPLNCENVKITPPQNIPTIRDWQKNAPLNRCNQMLTYLHHLRL